jgi:G3E family GTPase
MTTARTKIKDITDAELARRTHPSLSTTGIDLIVLKTIDDLTSEEVRKYNSKIKSINSDQKELNSLKEKDDDVSNRKKEELNQKIKESERVIKKQQSDLEEGRITSTIVESIRNMEVRNPENAIRDNLQLAGYAGKELNKVTAQSSMRHTQSLLDLKFRNNDIRNEYSKRNLNYFDSLRNDSGVVGPLNPGIPRGR